MANYKLIEFKFEEEHARNIISENSIYRLSRYGLVHSRTLYYQYGKFKMYVYQRGIFYLTHVEFRKIKQLC